MAGIGKEAAVFLYACLTGCMLLLAYQILVSFRRLIRHRLWLVNLEDLIFWLCASAYLFSQMYRTTYGEIRWYFILGVVLGCIVAYKCVRFLRKKKRKYKKRLEKQKETR